MKTFNIQYNIGKAKYVVNHYDGISKHKDGSKFYDMTIFKDKDSLNKFIAYLKAHGYVEESWL